ncbi:MAG: hypothetical protein ACLPVO_17890 [Desulfomonilaceae bacterium]
MFKAAQYFDRDLNEVKHHGSGIALGHPVGYPGVRIIVTLYYEVERLLGSQRAERPWCVWGRTGHDVLADKRRLKYPAVRKKRVALKYCGGCKPGFDRVEYFNRMCAAAKNSIEWVTLDDPDFDAILMISGCDTACPERSIDFSAYDRILSVRDDKSDPRQIVEALLK